MNVFDRGVNGGSGRFEVEVYPTTLPIEERHMGNPLYTLGHPEPTLEAALDSPHWWIFNPEE